MIGLKVDAIVGLTEVPAKALTQVHHDAGEEEVFHTVVKSADLNRVVSVLDVARLIELAVAWHAPSKEQTDHAGQARTADDVGADTADNADTADAAPPAPTALYALLGAGDIRMALPATELAEVIPMPELHAIGAMGGNGGSSYCLWRGRHIAVMDGAVMAGQRPSRAMGHRPRLLAILERDGLALGLAVREALELRDLPVPDDGALVSTVFSDDGGAIQVVDTLRLFAETPEVSLSKSNDTPAASQDPAQRFNASAYIVFQTEQHLATPIDPIEEILALKPEHSDARGLLLSKIEWRDKAIALVDLRPLETTPAVGGRVIVVRQPADANANGNASTSASAFMGFVVKQVVLLIPPNTGKLYRMGLGGSGGMELITTGEGADQVSYRTIDLTAV